MCLIVLAFQSHPRYPLIVVANRDEYYERPAAAADFWADTPGILAGRDLEAGGTWFGVNKHGRWSAVTNFRGGGQKGELSRGELPTNFLAERERGPVDYLGRVLAQGARYNGFSLLVGDAEQLAYGNNLGCEVEQLNAGIYTLSNDRLDTPWPKSELARRMLVQAIDASELRSEDLLRVLASRDCFPDGHLPDTGVGIEMERTLSPPFIVAETYGTRCTTVLMIDNTGELTFAEQSFLHGKPLGDLRQYRFAIEA